MGKTQAEIQKLPYMPSSFAREWILATAALRKEVKIMEPVREQWKEDLKRRWAKEVSPK